MKKLIRNYRNDHESFFMKSKTIVYLRDVRDEIEKIVKGLIVRDRKGTEATPSGWQPEKPTLKPRPDLAGKVWEIWKTGMAF